MKPIYKIFISILVPLAVGAVAGFFTSSSIKNWYAFLNKPFFNPPNWIFGPVWTLLYILMGISFYIIWRSEKQELKSKCFPYYWIQLVLNFLWSFLFFYFRNPAFALVDIILLLIFITFTIASFRKISVIAAWLLVPYILWVTFATALNFEIWRLN
jgi:translocator protein